MFAGRRAQAYCLSPVPTGGDLLVHTLLPQQKEPKAPSQLMASPAPNDERWRVFVSTCANTGLLIFANSTTTVSHLQAETVRRHNIQYPEHDVASCRRLYAKHALEQGNRGWWAVAESHLISGFAPPGEVHFHADLFDSAGNQCQPPGQLAAASAAGHAANSEPAAAVMVNPPQPVLPPIEHPPLGHVNRLGHVDNDLQEVESARQESGSGGNSQQDGSLHISVPSVAAQRHRLQQQLLQQQQQQEQQQQAQHGSQRAQHGSQPAQQQAQQQQQQQVQQGSQRAQHGSQHAQQQREGNIQSVSHKRRLSQAFAKVRGVEQTPGDEAEEGLQVKRQRHGGEQAVMAQHEQNPSGVPDKLSGKNKRQSLSRQAYKQKQRARRNPPSSQAAYQSGMTDPSQPAAAPTSRNPVQQVLGRQADVSMLLRPAAASAATVMTDPGPSAAAPVAHVTNVNNAKQPSGKLGRRQKMRLSFQRQLAAAQAAAVMQQQQQQQQPLKSKSKVDKPASVPTQDASKASIKPGLDQRPAASLKASDKSDSAPGSDSDSSSESSSGSETDPDVRLARSGKLTKRHLSSAATTAAPTAAATVSRQKTAAEEDLAANSDSDGEDEEEPNKSAAASAASSPSSSSEQEEEEKQMSEIAVPAQLPEQVTAAADESSSSEAESGSGSSEDEEEDQAALPASAAVPDQATSLQADSSPESSSGKDEEDEVSPTAQPSPDQARVASNSPSTRPSSSEDEEDEQMPDAPASVSDQALNASPEDSSDESSSVTSSSDSEEEDEQNPDTTAVPLHATASSSDESSSDSGDSEEEEDQAPKLSVSAPDQAPPDTPATTSSMSDDSSSDSSSEEEEDQQVPATTAALPDQAPPDSPESSSSDESSSDSSSEEDEDQPMRHASAAVRDLEPDVPAATTVPIQVAGSSRSSSSSDASSSDSDSSEEEDVAMPDAAVVPDQAASGDSSSSSDDSSSSSSSEEEDRDEPMPEAAAAVPNQAPIAMPDQAPHVPAAVPNQAPAAPQSSSDSSSNGSSSSGSSDEEFDQAAAPAAAAAADESSGGSVGSKNQISMAAAPAGNESSGECDNIASDREEAEDRPAAAQPAGHVADESPGDVCQEEGQDVLQAATAALRRMSTEAPSDSSGASSSSSDSSAASASPSSSSDDAASSGAPSSSSPGVSEGARDADADVAAAAAAAAAEEANDEARSRMTDDSAYEPGEGSGNESGYEAPAEPEATWAHETMSRQPVLLSTYANKDLKSLLLQAIEVKGLQLQSAARLEDEDDQVPAMDEQPGPSGAAPVRATSAGQIAEDRAKKQSKRASVSDKGPLVVSEDSECLDQVAQQPHQDWGKADKLAQITRRAVKAWLNEDRLTRGLKEVTSNIYINNTAPIWWPLPKWDSTQLHRKADCQKVYMALQKFMREAGQHQPQ